MPVKLTPTIVKRMAEAPDELKALVDLLVNASDDVMIEKLNLLLVDWNRPRGDLCPWIPLLNKFEVFMQQIVDKYRLEAKYIPPIAVTDEDETLCSTILKFTAFLLEKCSNRGAYNSAKLVNLLLRSTSTEILAQALHVCVTLSYRFAQSRTRKAMISVIDAELIYAFASLLPLEQNELGDHSTLSKFISSVNDWFPEEYSTVKIAYYTQQSNQNAQNTQNAWTNSPLVTSKIAGASGVTPFKLGSDSVTELPIATTSGGGLSSAATDAIFNTPTKPSRGASQYTPGNGSGSGALMPDEPYMFIMDVDTVKQNSIDDLYSKACAVLPEREWFEALRKIRLAKSCMHSTEALKLRRLLFSVQCYAFGFACCTYKQDALASKLRSDPSNIVKNLCTIVSPKFGEKGIDSEDVYLSLEALLCSTSHTDRRNDIITGLSALTSYGTLMSMIRYIIKSMKDDIPIDERVSTELLALLSELAGNVQIGTMLTSAGLLSALLDILSVENATVDGTYLKTMYFAAELLDHLIIDVRPTLTVFVELDGPRKLIDITNKSVKHCLIPSDGAIEREAPPDLCSVDYKLSFFRNQWLRSLLVVLSNMLLELNFSGNLANLVGPSLFEPLSNVIGNPEVFGTRLVSLSIHIVSSLLVTFSGAFPIMQEAGFIDAVLGHFDGLLKLHHIYYGDVAKVIASLFSNESGAELARNRRLIEKLFHSIRSNPEKLDSLPTVGNILNELCTDRSDLRPEIIGMVVSFVEQLPNTVIGLHQDARTTLIGRSRSYPSGVEGDAIIIPESQVDSYKLLTSAIGFVKAATLHHLNLYELKKNVDCIKSLLRLCELPNLPFDFANTTTQYSIARIAGALFLFDLNVEEMDSIICEALFEALSEMTAVATEFNSKLTCLDDLANLGNTQVHEAMRSLSIISSYLLYFYEIVLFDTGTGARATRVMDRLLKAKDNGKDVITEISRAMALCLDMDAKLASFTENVKLVEATSASMENDDYDSSFRTMQDAARALEASSPGFTSSLLFQRFRALRFLTSSVSVNATNVFSSLASVCFSEKSMLRDNSKIITALGKRNGLRVAEAIAKELVSILHEVPPASENRQLSLMRCNYIINALRVVSHVNVRDSGAKRTISLPVCIFFKQYGGLNKLLELLHILWPLTCYSSDDNAGDKNVAVFIIKNLLIFFIQLTSQEAVFFNNRKIINWLESSTSKRGAKDFSVSQFHTECKIALLNSLWDFFEDETIYKTNFQVSTCVLQSLQSIYSTGFQDVLESVPEKSDLPWNIDWRHILIDTESGEYQEKPSFVEAPVSTSGSRLVTDADLESLKDSFGEKLLSKVLNIVKHSPETVLVANTFIKKRLNLPVKPRTATDSGYPYQSHDCVTEAINLCRSDLDPLNGKFCSTEEDAGIAGMFHLVGMFLGDVPKIADERYEDLASFGDYLISLLKLEDIHDRFFYPYLLMILEKLVVFLEVPGPEDFKADDSFIRVSTSFGNILKDKHNISQEVFKFISRPVPPRTDTELISLIRLYTHYARDFDLASKLMSAGCIELMLDSIPRFSGSPLLPHFTGPMIILLRYTVETPEIVKNSMRDEIRHFFDHGKHDKFRAINVIRSLEVLVARSPKLFLEVFCDFVLFEQNTEFFITEELMDAKEYMTLQKLHDFRKDGGNEQSEDDVQDEARRKELLDKWSHSSEVAKHKTVREANESNGDDDTPNKAVKVSKPVQTHGVVELLLRKLFVKRSYMFVAKEAQAESITAPESNINSGNGKPTKLKPEDYPDFVYTSYLLRYLAELLQSYGSCKLEFIYFEKKPHHLHSKPRLYALTRLLKDFLPTINAEAANISDEPLVTEMKATLSEITQRTILSLMSCTYEHGAYALPNEIMDRTISYVRSCSLDVFSRAIREAVLFVHNNIDRKYCFLRAITELCNLMCFQENHFYKKSYIDGGQIAVMMYEKNYLNFFFHILSTLDLNHPDSGMIVRSVLKCCRKIEAVPASDVSNGKGKGSETNDQQEDDDPRPVVDLFDSTPMNVFQNSSLAFYDEDGALYDDSDDDIEVEEEGVDGADDHMEGIEYENVTSDGYSEVDEESDEIEAGYGDEDMEDDDIYPASYDDDSDSENGIDDQVELVIESYDEDSDSDSDPDDPGDDDMDDSSSAEGSDASGGYPFDEDLVEAVGEIRENIDYDDQVVNYDILELDAPNGQRTQNRDAFYFPVHRSHGGVHSVNDAGMSGDTVWLEDEEEDDVFLEGESEGDEISGNEEGGEEDDEEEEEEEDDDGDMEDGDSFLNTESGGEFYSDAWGTDHGLDFLGYSLFRTASARPLESRASHPLVYNGRASNMLTTPVHYPHHLAVLDGGESFFGLETVYNIRPFELIESPHGTSPKIFTGVMSLPGYHLSSDRYFVNQFNQFHFGFQHKPTVDLLATLKVSKPVTYSDRWTGGSSMFRSFKSRSDILLQTITDKISGKSVERRLQMVGLISRARKTQEESSATQTTTTAAATTDDADDDGKSHNKELIDNDDSHASNAEGEHGESHDNWPTGQRLEEEEEEAIPASVSDSNDLGVSNNDSVEPVYVTIAGSEVNVAGLGVDPTFLMALPDDIREEAFSQHLRETVSTAHANGQEAQDVLDPEFLNAIPPHILSDLGLRGLPHGRGHIHTFTNDSSHGQGDPLAPSLVNFLASFEELRYLLPDSSGQSGLPLMTRRIRRGDEDIEIDDIEEIDDTDSVDSEDGTSGAGPFNYGTRSSDMVALKYLRYGNQKNPWASFNSKEKEKVHYVLDKHVVSSLIRLIFMSLSHTQRGTLNHLLADLSSNKQNRIEIIKHLLNVIQVSSISRCSAEGAYSMYCNRALKGATVATGATPSSTSKSYVAVRHELPQGITPSIIIRQSLIALEKIIQHDASSVLLFLCENDVLNVSKADSSTEPASEKKFFLNMLLNILDCSEVQSNPSTLDDLTIVLREITKPLAGLKRGVETEAQAAKAQKLLGFYIPKRNVSKLAKVLTAKECNAKTFKQTLHVIYNLCVKKDIQLILGQELVTETAILKEKILVDLQRLTESLDGANGDAELQGQMLSQFSSADADQVKLLRILTAIDILFDRKKGEPEETSTNSQEKYLHLLYSQMNLGDIFVTLSKCLRTLEEGQEMMPSATALLALIESLMVVCKHSTVREVNLRESAASVSGVVSGYQDLAAARPDFSSKPLEQLFFTFTEEHRKVLNYMVRNNPRLMSGSFAILFKNPKALDFDNKRRYFYNNLKDSHKVNDKSLHVNVRRDHVFLDSYKTLHFRNPQELKESNFYVRFQGEEGVDEGGLSREWYQVLSRQMVNPDYALFTPVASDRTTFHPNRASWVNPEHLSFFKFVGRIIGKAIFDSKVVECHFSRAVYKRILGKPVSMKDMESLDLDYYKSLMWMLENDITDVITETFSIDTNDYGDQKTVDLKPNGRDIAVTEENKREYVQLVINYRLLQSVEPQLNAFLEGFHDIIPEDLIAIFDEQELELLISGLPDIDVDDWRANTVYNNFTESSTIVKWFWRAVRSFDAEEQAKLLQFVTGTSKVPLNGFKALEGMNGISKFSVHKSLGEPNRLPTSHTCFNQLDLPEYDSYETLRRALTIAISEGREGFGFA